MNRSVTTVSLATHLGVFWAVWGVHGFWWALLYGAFSEFWLAYRLALWLATA